MSIANTAKLPARLDFQLRLFDRLSAAVWVYDFDRYQIAWANRAALSVWDAASLEELTARDLRADLSISVKKRLEQFRTDLVAPDRRLRETWTLYPRGRPLSVRMTFSGICLDDGRLAMLVEGVPEQDKEPDTLRSAQALMHTSAMIFLVSKAGEVLYMNPAAHESRDDHETGFLARFSDQATGKRFIDAVQSAGCCNAVAEVKTANGARWHEIHARRCRDAVTGDVAYLISELDVTELKEAEARAETADRAKSDFLAKMSHELRTPLNAIIGFSDLMTTGVAGPALPPRYRDYTHDIKISGEHLLRLINDILDLQKVEMGEMDFEPEPASLADLLGGLCRVLEPQARVKGVMLAAPVIEPGLCFLADPLRTKQIFMNLLSNAIKFTPAGGTVEINAWPANDDVLICVKDTGIGMSEDEVEEAFKPFRQVDNSIARKFEGTGLGLPLSRILAEKQGGTLSIESEPAAGTKVIVSLPACPSISLAG